MHGYVSGDCETYKIRTLGWKKTCMSVNCVKCCRRTSLLIIIAIHYKWALWLTPENVLLNAVVILNSLRCNKWVSVCVWMNHGIDVIQQMEIILWKSGRPCHINSLIYFKAYCNSNISVWPQYENVSITQPLFTSSHLCMLLKITTPVPLYDSYLSKSSTGIFTPGWEFKQLWNLTPTRGSLCSQSWQATSNIGMISKNRRSPSGCEKAKCTKLEPFQCCLSENTMRPLFRTQPVKSNRKAFHNE